MSLQLVEYSDPRIFADAAMPMFVDSEAEYCVHIALTQRLRERGSAPFTADDLNHPLLLTVNRADQVELAVIQTHRKKMLLSRASDDAMQLLARELARRRWSGSEAIGTTPSVEVFARSFAQISGRAASIRARLRVLKLTAVKWPKPTAGSMHLCTPSDRNWLAQFIVEFCKEIGEPLEKETGESMADRRIAAQQVFCWRDGEVMAIASWAGPTPSGIRINFVYTPPQFRGNGYASNLVAQLSQRMLDEGRKFCFLHTDLANPISNSIYQKLGYGPVCDNEAWVFENRA